MSTWRFLIRQPRLLIVAVAVVAALVLVLAALTPQSHAQTGDLTAEAYTYLGCGKSVRSDATYFRAENRVVGHTALYNDCQLAGFKAAVIPVLSNANDRVVAWGEPQRYGIDAKGPCWPEVVSWWPFRTQWKCPPTLQRHIFWEEAVDPRAAATATKLTLIQYAAPNSWLESLQALRRHLDEAVAIGKSVTELSNSVKSIF